MDDKHILEREELVFKFNVVSTIKQGKDDDWTM